MWPPWHSPAKPGPIPGEIPFRLHAHVYCTCWQHTLIAQLAETCDRFREVLVALTLPAPTAKSMRQPILPITGYSFYLTSPPRRNVQHSLRSFAPLLFSSAAHGVSGSKHPRYPLREFTPCAPGRSNQQDFQISSGIESRIQLLQRDFQPRRATHITTDYTNFSDNIRSTRLHQSFPYPRSPFREFTPCAPGWSVPSRPKP